MGEIVKIASISKCPKARSVKRSALYNTTNRIKLGRGFQKDKDI